MNKLNYWIKYNLDKEHFHEWVDNRLQEFRISLHSHIFSDDESLIKLNSAIDYALFNEGKRFRPLLCIGAGEISGIKSDVSMSVAAAIEMTHVFSLCQDDLPFMDDDVYRHGKPSVHDKYDISTALLVCDVLISEAFSILSTLPLSDTRKVLLIQVLANTIGIKGMTGGQFLDLENNASNASIQLIERISYLKTTCLIQSSLKMGLLCCTNIKDADLNKYIKIMDRYGYLFGQAYQIIDDVLDCCCDKKNLGKTPGKDLRNNKATSVSAIGIKKSIDKSIFLLEESITQVQHLGVESFRLIGISLLMIEKIIILDGGCGYE